jgi:hypothetical protein
MNASRNRIAIFIGAAVMLAGVLICSLFNPRAAAAGWLVGFVFYAEILIGSLSLIMIHRLTSGRWGELIAPVTEQAAMALPFLAAFAVPLFIAIPTLYPWAQHPPSVRPDVLSLYLNRPGFILRSLAAIVGWSLLAFYLPRSRGSRGQLLAALGLVFHAVVISSVSIDWYLSIEAPFTSSSFGASVAISSLVAALACAIIRMPASATDPAIGDLGALLLATVLGITYIDFMAVLVIWYGDVPREEIWFVARSQFPWNALAVAAFLLGSLVPIAALIQSRFRNQQRPLRITAIIALVGLAAYDAYLVAPSAGMSALLPAMLALLGIGFVLIGIMIFATATPHLMTRERHDAR